MNETSWRAENYSASRRTVSETIREHRDRIALEEHERAQHRLERLAEQRSDLSSPEMRIRAWEKIHALRLPAAASHPILLVVAVATRLTLDQVQEEQRARAAHRPQTS